MEWLYSYGMVISILLVYPSDCMVAWELWLTAAAQHYERVL